MTSPNSTDYERIASKIYELYGKVIKNAEDYSDAFDKYMMLDIDKSENLDDKEDIRQKSWRYYTTSTEIPKYERNKIIKEETDIRKKRISKVKRERVPTKRIIRKRFKARKPSKKIVYEYKYPAKHKGKTVYTRRVKTKKGYRYFTKKGRLAKKL